MPKKKCGYGTPTIEFTEAESGYFVWFHELIKPPNYPIVANVGFSKKKVFKA